MPQFLGFFKKDFPFNDANCQARALHLHSYYLYFFGSKKYIVLIILLSYHICIVQF